MELSYIFSKKLFLMFQEIRLSYIFSRKAFSYISENETFLKKLFIFQQETFQACQIKKPHYWKISYILGNRTFLPQAKKTYILRKWDFLIFSQKKIFFIFHEINFFLNFLCQEGTLWSHHSKFFIFFCKKAHSENVFLYFGK